VAGEAIPSLILQIIDALRAHGIVITSRAGEWRVNYRDGAESTAYITDDLQDAFAHGRAMAVDAAAISPETGQPIRRRRRRRWPPKTAKAARRAFIRKHNRRRRSRALREQSTET